MRCLIISDIHANLVALESVLADAAGAYDALWCLGDVVGYGPQPNECVERLQALPNVTCLAGNHDWAAIGKLDLHSFNGDARNALLFTISCMSQSTRAFLEGLSPCVSTPPFTLAHGSPRHPIWEYILNGVIAALNFDAFPTSVCFVGHTHSAIVFSRPARGNSIDAEVPPYDRPLPLPQPGGARLIINPGSVGQPRDSDPRAGYGLLDTDALTYTPRRIAYPVHETQKRMRRAGMPPRLIARLEYGW